MTKRTMQDSEFFKVEVPRQLLEDYAFICEQGQVSRSEYMRELMAAACEVWREEYGEIGKPQTLRFRSKKES